MIDWNVATATGVRWARPGPEVTMAEARKVVAELRQIAAAVAEPVADVTGLAGAYTVGQVAVVDRPGWIRANVDGFRVVLDPLVEHMRQTGTAPQRLGGRGGRIPGHRHAGGPHPRLPGRPGAGPV